MGGFILRDSCTTAPCQVEALGADRDSVQTRQFRRQSAAGASTKEDRSSLGQSAFVSTWWRTRYSATFFGCSARAFCTSASLRSAPQQTQLRQSQPLHRRSSVERV